MGGLDYYPSKFRWQQEKDERREKKAEINRQYYHDNKEKIIEHREQYRENNKEMLAEQQRQYNQTPNRKKNSRIRAWKKQGIKLPDEYPDWSLFYEEEYMKTTKCEECLVELTEANRLTSTTKCLDHSHETGEFRNILCNCCNIKRG